MGLGIERRILDQGGAHGSWDADSLRSWFDEPMASRWSMVRLYRMSRRLGLPVSIPPELVGEFLLKACRDDSPESLAGSRMDSPARMIMSDFLEMRGLSVGSGGTFPSSFGADSAQALAKRALAAAPWLVRDGRLLRAAVSGSHADPELVGTLLESGVQVSPGGVEWGRAVRMGLYRQAGMILDSHLSSGIPVGPGALAVLFERPGGGLGGMGVRENQGRSVVDVMGEWAGLVERVALMDGAVDKDAEWTADSLCRIHAMVSEEDAEPVLEQWERGLRAAMGVLPAGMMRGRPLLCAAAAGFSGLPRNDSGEARAVGWESRNAGLCQPMGMIAARVALDFGASVDDEGPDGGNALHALAGTMLRNGGMEWGIRFSELLFGRDPDGFARARAGRDSSGRTPGEVAEHRAAGWMGSLHDAMELSACQKDSSGTKPGRTRSV